MMKVWIVMGRDYEIAWIEEVFDAKDKADEHRELLMANREDWQIDDFYYVAEKEVK